MALPKSYVSRRSLRGRTRLHLYLGCAAHTGRRRRVNRLLRVSEAWLRGNLALRATESGHDEISLLGRQLNLLTEHLEEDEQDLERLHESNTRLTDQVRALAVVEERNRLARELHDSVKQHLFSLAMTASAVRTHYQLLEQAGKPVPPDLVEMVQEIETAAQTAQRETTRLIEDLRPGPLQERGLVAALNDFSLIFVARQHLLVYFDVQCNDQWLPPVVTEVLYRVAQEAMHNVGRHARATRVDMQLRCSGHRGILTIEDNGVGFDTGRTRKGLGISSMQDRLISNGGRLTVEAPGHRHNGAGRDRRHAACHERRQGRCLIRRQPQSFAASSPLARAGSQSGTPLSPHVPPAQRTEESV